MPLLTHRCLCANF
nr:unnamed protein product [Callosobruchus chinensis]